MNRPPPLGEEAARQQGCRAGRRARGRRRRETALVVAEREEPIELRHRRGGRELAAPRPSPSGGWSVGGAGGGRDGQNVGEELDFADVFSG